MTEDTSPIRGRLDLRESCRVKARVHENIARSHIKKRWGKSIFIGLCKRTGQYRIFADGIVKYARTVMRLPDGEKWNLKPLQDVNICPWHVHVSKAATGLFHEKFEDDETLKEAMESVLKSVRNPPPPIKKADLIFEL